MQRIQTIKASASQLTTNQGAVQNVWVWYRCIEVVKTARGWRVGAGSSSVVRLHRGLGAKAHNKAYGHSLGILQPIRTQHILCLRPRPALIPVGVSGVCGCNTRKQNLQYLHSYSDTRIHTHIHTYIHTHIYTPRHTPTRTPTHTRTHASHSHTHTHMLFEHLGGRCSRLFACCQQTAGKGASSSHQC